MVQDPISQQQINTSGHMMIDSFKNSSVLIAASQQHTQMA